MHEIQTKELLFFGERYVLSSEQYKYRGENFIC